MRLSGVLSVYIGKNFFYGFLLMLLSLMGLTLLIDIIDLLRRASSVPSVTFPLVVEMGLLRIPHIGRQLFPFAVLFGAMLTFWRLSRNQELVIARAGGISVWQFMLPALAVAVLIGAFKIAAISPLAAATLQRFEMLEARHLEGKESLFTFSGSGLWLRQAGEQGQTVIFAQTARRNADAMDLHQVEIYIYAGTDKFQRRIDGKSAVLKEGYWLISDAIIQSPEGPSRREATLNLETDLTLGRIQDSLARPEVMSFWELPGFIRTLEDAGFSAVRHRLFMHSLLSSPALMCAMVLIAAIFTLRKQMRQGGALIVTVGGVLSGFVVYIFSDVAFALGASSSIPVYVAVWAPPAAAGLLGAAILFHLEDG